MTKPLSGAQIRKSYIEFFEEQGHTFVPSSSLVPGGDATLLFTNAGMVQFKDVFLGTDKRPYTRAANSQKCMRVAGKHNDLDDVGRDDTHHTFFEMLGNWSFGDYYKKEAIAWAWQLLTEVWGLPKESLYATVFKDEKNEIPTDEEAATFWKEQPGFAPERLFYLGRKDNFWEMADTGPCGPCSEIHIDLRPHEGAVTVETLDSDRFIELWNLVFIQYNRTGPDSLEPLPATHVDTGMGFERIVSVLQGVDSNYKTDLFAGALQAARNLTGHSEEEMLADFTPYRVIADHTRTAAFLIADGVVPGNVGRNYVCRMIIRRAARFGSKIGLNQPFMAAVAAALVETYGDFFPELLKNKTAILENLTREEERFARTVESGTAHLQGLLDAARSRGEMLLNGGMAFDLYATYGLPLEITRDIAREQGMDVEEKGFREAMDEHRLASGAGKAMGALGGEDAERFASLYKRLVAAEKLPVEGVRYDPYQLLSAEGEILALVVSGQSVEKAVQGDLVEVILPQTGFYVESGGQVSDSGKIIGADWVIEVTGMRKPAAGIITHLGKVTEGAPVVGARASAQVDMSRRRDIMRNHTATHLLHAALHEVVGDMARQAGSLVAPDRLRFDFTHPEALTVDQLAKVEWLVNQAVAADMQVLPLEKSREQAIAEGAMALFGEKYGETVRTLTIAGDDGRYSYELCGGTHLDRTGDVGAFLLTGESSIASGVRRIEAVTGRGAYDLISKRFRSLNMAAGLLSSTADELPVKVESLQDEIANLRKDLAGLRTELALSSLGAMLSKPQQVQGINLVSGEIAGADKDTLAKLSDRFRAVFPASGVCVIASAALEQVVVMVSVTQDLNKKGIKAGELVGYISRQLGAGGGGAPHLAFGGGKQPEKIAEALASVPGWLSEKLS